MSKSSILGFFKLKEYSISKIGNPFCHLVTPAAIKKYHPKVKKSIEN